VLARRSTDTDGDNLAMAVNDGYSDESTSVSDTTVDLRVGLDPDGRLNPDGHSSGSDSTDKVSAAWADGIER
jgi:hypothetical protein